MKTKSLTEGKNEGNLKYVDDTLGGAKDDREMDVRVTNFLPTCRENKITLNPDKFQISRHVEFGGFELECEIDESGNYKTHIYPSKVAINKVDKFPEPKTKKQLQQLLGLVNVFKLWSTKLTAKSGKMREALKKGIKYKFNEEIK